MTTNPWNDNSDPIEDLRSFVDELMNETGIELPPTNKQVTLDYIRSVLYNFAQHLYLQGIEDPPRKLRQLFDLINRP